jgi:hypothetical protein
MRKVVTNVREYKKVKFKVNNLIHVALIVVPILGAIILIMLGVLFEGSATAWGIITGVCLAMHLLHTVCIFLEPGYYKDRFKYYGPVWAIFGIAGVVGSIVVLILVDINVAIWLIPLTAVSVVGSLIKLKVTDTYKGY